MIPRFRAWHKKLNEFVRVDKHCVIDQYGQISCSDDVVLMQSTGLHDKNGVEIFSGDIVVSSRGVGVVETKIGHAPQVTYKNGNDLLRFVFENLSVIGNIYANQELLEQQNG